jgi:hypothetical protein
LVVVAARDDGERHQSEHTVYLAHENLPDTTVAMPAPSCNGGLKKQPSAEVDLAPMSESRSSWWRDVWVSLTKDLIKDSIYAVLALLLVSALVKSARDWLLADSHVVRGAVALLVVVLIVVVAYLLRARNQASTAVAPQVDRQASEDFMWSPIRGCVLAALLDRMDKQTDIEKLYAALIAAPDMELPLLWRERLARDLEAAERAGIVRIERPGGSQRYYYLTGRGRDWLINKIDEARAILTEHNRLSTSATPQEPQPTNQVAPSATSAAALPLTKLLPMPTQELPAAVQFAPETFELTPPRRRALLVLRHRVDARTTLHDLHELVTDDGTHVDRQTTKAQLQHDMEAAERAGIVSIERVPGGYADYYRLTIPAGRDWVLSRQHELQAEAGKGMTRKERGPRYS